MRVAGKLVNKFVKMKRNKQLWRKRRLQFVRDGVLYGWELKSTVQIHGVTSLQNENGFCSPPLPVVRDHSFHLDTFPINVVVSHSNTIPFIASFYSLLTGSSTSFFSGSSLSHQYIHGHTNLSWVSPKFQLMKP